RHGPDQKCARGRETCGTSAHAHPYYTKRASLHARHRIARAVQANVESTVETGAPSGTTTALTCRAMRAVARAGSARSRRRDACAQTRKAPGSGEFPQSPGLHWGLCPSPGAVFYGSEYGVDGPADAVAGAAALVGAAPDV